MTNSTYTTFGVRATVMAIASSVFALASTYEASAAAPPKEAGVWFDDTGKGAVRIEPCGGDKLCGRIVWLKEQVNEQGEVLTDKRNPDESQRTRTICGLPILGQLAPMPEGGFDGGWVYDPKQGASFSVAIELVGQDQLTVTGYKGVRFLGKKFTWTRAKVELPSCEKKQALPEAKKQKAPTATAADAATKDRPAAAKPKKAAATVETLPWNSKGSSTAGEAPAGNPSAASKLGAANAKPALKKTQAPVQNYDNY